MWEKAHSAIMYNMLLSPILKAIQPRHVSHIRPPRNWQSVVGGLQ